jgi:hypothetical protein
VKPEQYNYAMRVYMQLIDASDPVMTDDDKGLNSGEAYPSLIYRLAKQYVNAVESQPTTSRSELFREIFDHAWKEEK